MTCSPKPRCRIRSGFLIIMGLLLTSTILVEPLKAQPNGVTFEHISLEQGLSQTTVYCIFQDRRGFMWFGTRDGLNRYDGYRFTVYKHAPDNPYSLSNNGVRAIYEDRAGTLWVGTESGLNRYDRARDAFVRYVNDPGDPRSLSHNRVRTLLEDRSGTLWVGTFGGGLNKLVPGDHAEEPPTFVRYQHDPNNPASLSANTIYASAEDHTGALWIGTVGGGLNRFDPQTGTVTRYLHDPQDPASLAHNDVNAVYEDRAGTLWIGTRGGGLNRFIPPAPGRGSAGAFLHYRHDPRDPRSLSHDNVNVIRQDQTGTLWIGTYGDGLDRLVPGAYAGAPPAFVHYRHAAADPGSLSHNLIRSLYEDRTGVLWIGTSEGGINKLDRTRRKFDHYRHNPGNPRSLSAHSVSALYEDRQGTLWVGTYGGGLNRRVPGSAQDAPPTFIHYRQDPGNPHALGSDVVASLYEDRAGVLWVGTLGGGLSALDLASAKPLENEHAASFTHYRHDPTNPASLSNNRVMAVYEDPDEAGQVLWVGTFGGLNRLDRAAGTVTRYLHDPQDPTSLSHNRINVLYEDGAGRLWVGTRGGGVNLFDRDAQRFTRYLHDPNDPNSLSHNDVNALYEAAGEPGVLWIGTQDGLNKLDLAHEVFVQYGEEEGLLNDAILGILEDEQGYLWVSTYRGLSKFDPRTETFKTYDVHDGLQSNEFNGGAFHKNRQGELFFGGINGYNAFYPQHIVDDPYAPQVVITDFQLFNKPVSPGTERLPRPITETAEIVLSYRESVFSFEFAALHYSVPEKNQYAYRMEGFEEAWVSAGTRRFATYTNLDPGIYTLRVRGANRDGVWNEEGTALRITIHPPWWQTRWAYAGYGVLVLAGFFALERAQRRRLLRRERERTREREREQARQIENAYHKLDESHRHLKATQAQLVQQEKMASLGQLTAGIAHEIQNPLNFVNNFAVLSVGLVEELYEVLDARSERLGEASPEAWEDLLSDLRFNAGRISEHGKRAEGIIRSMLAHARTPTGERRATDVNALLNQYVALAYHGMRARYPDLTVTLDRAYDETLTPVEMVPQEIGRVLLNLLHNAFDAVHEMACVAGSAYVPTVGVHTGQGGGLVEIRVCDNGPGVPGALQEKIFEPFFTTKPAGKGIGLGLSLAHEIVVQGHGGTLTVQSTEGLGAVFIITLARDAHEAGHRA